MDNLIEYFYLFQHRHFYLNVYELYANFLMYRSEQNLNEGTWHHRELYLVLEDISLVLVCQKSTRTIGVHLSFLYSWWLFTIKLECMLQMIFHDLIQLRLQCKGSLLRSLLVWLDHSHLYFLDKLALCFLSCGAKFLILPKFIHLDNFLLRFLMKEGCLIPKVG